MKIHTMFYFYYFGINFNMDHSFTTTETAKNLKIVHVKLKPNLRLENEVNIHYVTNQSTKKNKNSLKGTE